MRIADSNRRMAELFKQDKHFQHAMKALRDTLSIKEGFDIWQLPVCERCEAYGVWHKEDERAVGVCRSCGHTTKNPITVEEYYANDYAKDRVGMGRSDPYIVDRDLVNKSQINTVFGGEAGLADTDKKIIIARR